MGNWAHPDLPAALSRAQRKIEQWRERHRPRARIPEELWREVARLACVCGINRTARALRLDYYALKKRATAAAESGEPVAQLVEVLPGGMPAPGSACTIELEDASGVKMRIHLQGREPPDIVALVRLFREGGA